MENDGYKEIKDVPWEQITNCGEIKFRKDNRKPRIKGFFKGIAFILVAAVSGGVTSAIIVDKKYSSSPSPYTQTNQANQSLLEQKNGYTQTAKLPKNSITMVAETVGPTVVGVNNTVEGFFGDVNQDSGSGIIFDKSGYIVTNYHVIQGADKVYIKLPNGSKPLQAKFVGADASSDLAVIKIEGENFPVAKFGDSSKVKAGDVAVAIGNPLGDEFAGSVTAGIISATNRKLQIKDNKGRVTTYKVLQTDAAINPGNSGGALCNEAGEIIGINSLKIGGNVNAEGMGFAISINEAKNVIQKIMNGAKPSDKQKVGPNAVLGIVGFTAVPQENNGVKGVYVQEVTGGLGGETAGIKPTDIIIELDKTKIETYEQLQEVLWKHKAGDTITCKVLREGKVLSFDVTLSERQ
ncbi:S1C family serine protease [Clostridium omnivorum]|uniref:Protease n=1 Tax=Clostridium omnivorum TaxID=1604902 RepID=A0ABQ5N439_9CLOT|nr:trypsin-like peptidase domain-containing protein [Clostridium sp. E14]GLC29955.1 protease [Clostridium sp. E14]